MATSIKVGDQVRIVRVSAPQYGEVGRVTELRVVSRIDHMSEWWVEFADGITLSWRESSLRVITQWDELVHQVLGEDYFA